MVALFAWLRGFTTCGLEPDRHHGYVLTSRDLGEAARMHSIALLIDTIINILVWMLIIQAVLSWLVAFNIVNPYNKFVHTVGDTLNRLTEPLLRPIRHLLPNLGGIDIAPVILILILTFGRNLLFEFLVS